MNETLETRVKERTALAVRRADELAVSEAALRDSEALYRSLVDHLPMCVLRKDLDGRLLFVNERFCASHAKTADELLGLFDEDLYPPPLAEKYRRDDHTVVESDCVLQDVDDAWAATAPALNGKQATLHKHSQEGAPDCQVDVYKIEQVFRNLFENAVAACDEPVRLEVMLELTTLELRPAVRIKVRDHGPGLTDEQQARIFDAFYTTKSKGSGLGLAIVKRIVEAHHGSIEAQNGNGAGAEFVITLPRGDV